MSVVTEKDESHSQIGHEETMGRIKLRFKLKLPEEHLNEHRSLLETKCRGQVDSEVTSSDTEEESPLDDDEALFGGTEGCEPIPACPECAKIFPSLKSLYGHLRSHPERRYRGVRRPRGAQRRPAPPISDWAAKAKRGRPNLVDEEEVNAAAETLIDMSQAKHASDGPARKKAKSYRCSTCNKSFPTHQALGGHRASHNKYGKNGSDGEATEGAKEAVAEHRCKTCNENFATGQALGGHMRRHYNFPPARTENHAPNDFDLNKLPQHEEG